MPGFLRQMLSAFPSTRSESTALPTASVRQSPLLLTFVTRFLYLWELWKNHGINSSTWEVASLGINQSYGGKRLPHCQCILDAWPGITGLSPPSAGLSVMIWLLRAHPGPHLGHTWKAHFSEGIIRSYTDGSDCWWRHDHSSYSKR